MSEEADVSRPYVVASCAVSLDGCIDDNSGERLLLSNAEDFDRVDEVRASCDAILVGANTVRRDNPRLMMRSAQRRSARVGEGKPESPMKVTVTTGLDLDPGAKFFTTGGVAKVVYTTAGNAAGLAERLGDVAEVVAVGDRVDPVALLGDVGSRGVGRLMVEGGTSMHTLFLVAGLVDEVHLVVAPFFVGDPSAPRFVGAGQFPWGSAVDGAKLLEARPIGDCVLLRYGLSAAALR